ncbi:MAG TPA: glycine/sarcosine/betaine reductase complex component C subunit beta [Methylomirabilota bacterium]|jgi:betaine reductase|nr:glycine/sarcosine/betaine reductase complex component C subunit beta [Methylomirabilota bacterium]
MKPVIRGVRYFLAHTPGLVRHGSKPARDIAATPGLLATISGHLRPYADAVAYPPHRAFLGALFPDDLRALPRPWFRVTGDGQRRQPHGEIMPETEFYGLLRICDVFDLVWLEAAFAREVRQMLAGHPLIQAADLDRLGDGLPTSAIETHVAAEAGALPLHLADGRLVGCVNRAHEADATLTADVILENLACKASAVMALRTLMADERLDPERLEYVLNSGEEAVGERYQRGGGNLAKAIGELCALSNATGSDVKAFCCGPLHALVMAGALVSAGVYREVAVVGGCSLAKLGMKFQGHLRHDQPILEDTLAAVAIVVGPDDGRSPVLRLDSVGRHTVGAGSAQQAIFERLVSEPLARLRLGFQDVDKYATELQNPELTEPAGSGDVAKRNYQLIAALAVAKQGLAKEDVADFTRTHGLPGFSPTQGHIASAVPFLGHGVDRMRDGRMQRVMFLAKGSLFLGRMTQGSDGLSVVLERNPGG